MIVITTPLAAVGFLSIVYLGILFASFSQRLCAVTKKKDRSGWFQVANAFIALAATSQIVRGTAELAPDLAPSILLAPGFSLASFHIPLAIGLTIDLILVWHYWEWIFKEKIK